MTRTGRDASARREPPGYCIAFLSGLAAPLAVVEARRGRPEPEVPVLLSFGTAATDGIRSDGFTAPGYAADYADRVENVQAVLYPAGNLGFSTQADSRQAAVRAVCLNFGEQPVPFSLPRSA